MPCFATVCDDTDLAPIRGEPSRILRFRRRGRRRADTLFEIRTEPRAPLLGMPTATSPSQGSVAAFVPIFRFGAGRTAIDSEMSTLRRRFPGHVEQPWHQDETAGRRQATGPERNRRERVPH